LGEGSRAIGKWLGWAVFVGTVRRSRVWTVVVVQRVSVVHAAISSGFPLGMAVF